LITSVVLTGARKKDKAPESYSVVAGTVFREPGLALAGVDVTLTRAAGDAAPQSKQKLSFSTNTRGEFAFRLPSVKARYTLAVNAKGYVAQQKAVETEPGERVEVTFLLAKESNK